MYVVYGKLAGGGAFGNLNEKSPSKDKSLDLTIFDRSLVHCWVHCWVHVLKTRVDEG